MAITADEIRKAFDMFKKEGRSDEEILAAWYFMFKDGDFTAEELRNLYRTVGYDLSDDFMNMSEEDQKNEKLFFQMDE